MVDIKPGSKRPILSEAGSGQRGKKTKLTSDLERVEGLLAKHRPSTSRNFKKELEKMTGDFERAKSQFLRENEHWVDEKREHEQTKKKLQEKEAQYDRLRRDYRVRGFEKDQFAEKLRQAQDAKTKADAILDVRNKELAIANADSETWGRKCWSLYNMLVQEVESSHKFDEDALKEILDGLHKTFGVPLKEIIEDESDAESTRKSSSDTDGKRLR